MSILDHAPLGHILGDASGLDTDALLAQMKADLHLVSLNLSMMKPVKFWQSLQVTVQAKREVFAVKLYHSRLLIKAMWAVLWSRQDR